jgi:hypothetical protein
MFDLNGSPLGNSTRGFDYDDTVTLSYARLPMKEEGNVHQPNEGV